MEIQYPSWQTSPFRPSRHSFYPDQARGRINPTSRYTGYPWISLPMAAGPAGLVGVSVGGHRRITPAGATRSSVFTNNAGSPESATPYPVCPALTELGIDTLCWCIHELEDALGS
jgi:hypothetical protein